MLPFLEQQAAFNAVNFEWNVFTGQNITMAGIGISTLTPAPGSACCRSSARAILAIP
jgi:hypothetical protein